MFESKFCSFPAISLLFQGGSSQSKLTQLSCAGTGVGKVKGVVGPRTSAILGTFTTPGGYKQEEDRK